MTVLMFPGCEPEPEPTPTPAEAPSFEDWQYTEVVDAQIKFAALADLPEDEFWPALDEVRRQINGWSRE